MLCCVTTICKCGQKRKKVLVYGFDMQFTNTAHYFIIFLHRWPLFLWRDVFAECFLTRDDASFLCRFLQKAKTGWCLTTFTIKRKAFKTKQPINKVFSPFLASLESTLHVFFASYASPRSVWDTIGGVNHFLAVVFARSCWDYL